jgi:hypothetical protein
MSNADGIMINVEEIIARIVAEGLRDPAWIANAYIERIDPERRMPDLIKRRMRCLTMLEHSGQPLLIRSTRPRRLPQRSPAREQRDCLVNRIGDTDQTADRRDLVHKPLLVGAQAARGSLELEEGSSTTGKVENDVRDARTNAHAFKSTGRRGMPPAAIGHVIEHDSRCMEELQRVDHRLMDGFLRDRQLPSAPIGCCSEPG